MVRIVLSHGDPNGIGPEILLKALADDRLAGRARFIITGSHRVMDRHAGLLGLQDVLGDVEIQAAGDPETPVEPGRISPEAGSLAVEAVTAGCDLCLAGRADALVTAPISKEAIHLAGFAFPGHTEYLAERTGGGTPVMLLAADDLRVALLTTHLPLADVPAAITTARVVDVVQRLNAGLKLDFGIRKPSLALLGLNPHAGDGGVLGKEEVEILMPAIESLREEEIDIAGPDPADAFFGRAAYRDVDAVLACYHDQGLAPFKALAMGRGVNVTLGLPIIRTSPDHGTAFAIAGRNQAEPGSMVAAIELAINIAGRRRSSLTL